MSTTLAKEGVWGRGGACVKARQGKSAPCSSQSRGKEEGPVDEGSWLSSL